MKSTEVGTIRIEQLKNWIDKNKEFLQNSLVTERAEIVLSMKGSSIKAKVTQFPDDN